MMNRFSKYFLAKKTQTVEDLEKMAENADKQKALNAKRLVAFIKDQQENDQRPRTR